MGTSPFKIRWWKWYLVNLTDWHKPVLVKIEFNSEKQAISYRDRHLNNDFNPIIGHRAKAYNLSQKAPGENTDSVHPTLGKDKYDYPRHVVTEHDRHLFRHYERRKAKKMKRLPEIKHEDMLMILEGKITRFLIRTSTFRHYHLVFTEPSPNLKYYQRISPWPFYLRIMTIIEKTLLEYGYDIGPWPLHVVVIKIYTCYWKLVLRWIRDKWHQWEPNEFKYKITKPFLRELKARGFIPFEESGYQFGDYYQYFDYEGKRWVYKEKAWWWNPGKKADDNFLTWQYSNIEIPGLIKSVWYPNYLELYERGLLNT